MITGHTPPFDTVDTPSPGGVRYVSKAQLGIPVTDNATVIKADNSALRTQVGGDHYNKLRIQPMEYILANNIRFPEGSVIKYVTRWKDKNGIEDLRKARQTIDVIIEDALANGWPDSKVFEGKK